MSEENRVTQIAEALFNAGVPCRTTLAVESPMEFSTHRRALTLQEIKSDLQKILTPPAESAALVKIYQGILLDFIREKQAQAAKVKAAGLVALAHEMEIYMPEGIFELEARGKEFLERVKSLTAK